MSEPMAAVADCEHHFGTHIRGGEPLSVRICVFCRLPDWVDLREQLDVLYGGNEAALTRVLGGGRTAHVIAYNLNAQGYAIERVRYMTDEQLLAVPGIGETSLAWIRNAFPSLDLRPPSAAPARTQEYDMTDRADQVVQRPPARFYEVRTVHGGIYRAEGDVIESGDGWFTLWADQRTLALRVPEADIRAVRQVTEGEQDAEDTPGCSPGCCVDNDSFAPTTCTFCGSRERCVNHPGAEALKQGAPGHPFSPSGPQPDEPDHAADELREQLAEARSWARHGYEIGQKHCGWSDHGVAPEWLTEGWPPHIESCGHLKHAADLEEAEAIRKRVAKECRTTITDALGVDRLRDWDDIRNAAHGIRKQRDALAEALERVRAVPTEPEVMNAQQEHAGVWLRGYKNGVLAARDAARPQPVKEASES